MSRARDEAEWTRCTGRGSAAVAERPGRAAQGCCRLRRRACRTSFGERSGTVLNRAQHPSDVIALVVPWRLRRALRLRDLPGRSALRGMAFRDGAVRELEARLTPVLARALLAGQAEGVAPRRDAHREDGQVLHGCAVPRRRMRSAPGPTGSGNARGVDRRRNPASRDTLPSGWAGWLEWPGA